MASEWKLIWNEYEWDMQEIPIEISANDITTFSTNTSKLVLDKGKIK